MTAQDRPPLTDEDGEVRELTAADFLWFIRPADFGGSEAAHAFLKAREAFLQQAEALGMERSAFLPFNPTQPGFIERAASALEALARHARHAAE